MSSINQTGDRTMTKTVKQILTSLDKGEYLGKGGVDQALKEIETIISEQPIHHHPEHMAYMHLKELVWLKSLQMHEGVLMYNTGVILQPVSDRIQMYEDMLTRSPDTYKKVTALYGKDEK